MSGATPYLANPKNPGRGTGAALRRADVAADPVEQFADWFGQAEASEIAQPNAMFLATVGAAGQPSGRIVLLKAYGAVRGDRR